MMKKDTRPVFNDSLPVQFVNTTQKIGASLSQEVEFEKICDLLLVNFFKLFGSPNLVMLFITENSSQNLADCSRYYIKRLLKGGKIFPGDQSQAINWQIQFASQKLFRNPALELRNLLIKNHPHFLTEANSDFAFLPLFAQNQLQGLLVVSEPALVPEFELHIPLIEAFATWASVTLDYAWHFERLQRFNKELEEKVLARTLEIKKSNDELEVALRQLKETQVRMIQHEKMAGLGLLTAGIAHEINNPLAFVVNNVSLAQRHLQTIEVLWLLEKFNSAQIEMSPSRASEALIVFEKIKLLDRFRKDVQDFETEYFQVSENQKFELLVNFLSYAYQVLKTENINTDAAFKKMASYLEDSSEGLERSKKIILDLRHFSRLDEAEFQFANIDAGIVSTLNVIGHLAKEKNIVFKTDFQIRSLVPCFPSKLNQVVMNLVVNAIQVSEIGSSIAIKSRDFGSSVEISVEDYGPGIAPENLTKIFDPFFTTKPIGEGTGLGLSLSYQIMQEHKGAIRVESQLRKGSLFTLQIPVHERKAL